MGSGIDEVLAMRNFEHLFRSAITDIPPMFYTIITLDLEFRYRDMIDRDRFGLRQYFVGGV